MAPAPKKWNPETCALRGQILETLQRQDIRRQQVVDQLFEEVKSQRQAVLDALNASTTAQKDFNGRLVEVESGLSKILNVRANGSVGFEAVMHEIIEATRGIRIRRQIVNAIAAWFENHATLSKLLKWFLPKIVLFIVALLVMSYLQEKGVTIDVFKLLSFLK